MNQITSLAVGIAGMMSFASLSMAVYVVDGGTADKSMGFTGPAGSTGDILWLNRFPVVDSENTIHTISVAYGCQGTGVPNGTPVTILLYEDLNGGSTRDAVLRAAVDGTVQDMGTDTFVSYSVPPTAVRGFLLVGVVLRNQQQGWYPAALDFTEPIFPNTSYAGFLSPGGSMNINDLSSIRSTNYGTIEGFGRPGNWLVRAFGTATTTSPIGVGAASPSSVHVGEGTLLTVTAYPGQNPSSTGMAVIADLSNIGGPASQPLFDDGTHGDVTAGDNVFSVQTTVLSGAAPQEVVTFTVQDSQSRASTGSLVIGIIGCGSADFDCDGDLGTDADIESFFACLAGNCPPPPCNGTADFNGDGDIGTDADIESFFRVLAGGSC
jgi:hypothetical protein